MKKLLVLVIIGLVLSACGSDRPKDPKLFAKCVEGKSPNWLVGEVGYIDDSKESLYVSIYLKESMGDNLFYFLSSCWRDNFSKNVKKVRLDWFYTQDIYSISTLKTEVIGVLFYTVILKDIDMNRVIYMIEENGRDRWYIDDNTGQYISSEYSAGRIAGTSYTDGDTVVYEVNPNWVYSLDTIVKDTISKR